MAKRRIGETMAIADDETRAFVMDALNDRVIGAATELIEVACGMGGSEGRLDARKLAEVARRLVAAIEAYQQADGNGTG